MFDCALKMMNCVLKMTDCVLKMTFIQLYPELTKFVELCKAHDPEGNRSMDLLKFRNESLEQMIDF